MEEGFKKWMGEATLLGKWLGISAGVMVISYLGWFDTPRGLLERAMFWGHDQTGRVIYILQTPMRMVAFNQNGLERIADLEERLARMSVSWAESERINPDLTQPGTVEGKYIETSKRGILALGEYHGLEGGEVLVGEGGILVGRVVGVGKYTSTVMRPYDLNAQIGVRVLNKTTTGIISGDGVSAKITGVLQSDSLELGDVVVTSGADELYPEGLVVGEVTGLSGEAAEVTKGGDLSLMKVNFNKVWVMMRERGEK